MILPTIPIYYFTGGQCNEARKKRHEDQKQRNKIVSIHRELIVYMHNVNESTKTLLELNT